MYIHTFVVPPNIKFGRYPHFAVVGITNSRITLFPVDSNVAIQIGRPHSFASASLLWKLPKYDMKLRLALK